jgi:hypothetical protein
MGTILKLAAYNRGASSKTKSRSGFDPVGFFASGHYYVSPACPAVPHFSRRIATFLSRHGLCDEAR